MYIACGTIFISLFFQSDRVGPSQSDEQCLSALPARDQRERNRLSRRADPPDSTPDEGQSPSRVER